MQEGPVRRRYRIPDTNIEVNVWQTHASLYQYVPWSKGYKNQLELFKLIHKCTLKMSLCKLVYNGDSVLWMGAAAS